MRTPVFDRVMAKTQTDENGCWVFTGCRVVGGYGQIRDGGKTLYSHRVAYENAVGPIPDGYQVDHLCRNSSCVNPEHLEAVTPAENQARTIAGRRGQHVAAANLSKTHCPRGHAYDDTNTYRDPDGGRACRACRRERYAEKSAS